MREGNTEMVYKVFTIIFIRCVWIFSRVYTEDGTSQIFALEPLASIKMKIMSHTIGSSIISIIAIHIYFNDFIMEYIPGASTTFSSIQGHMFFRHSFKLPFTQKKDKET